MRTLILISIFVMAFWLAACDATSPNQDSAIQNEEGGALLAEATRAAARVISERKTATLQAATMNANSTSEANERRATGTAQAIWAYEQQRDARATDQALSIQGVQTRQAATDTAVAHRSQATGTARADAMNLEATQTAAFATRGAQEILVAQELHQATATAEALEIRRTQAQEDAARAVMWSEFIDSILKIIVAVGGIGLLLLGMVQLARYLDIMAQRQRVLETRAGTIMVFAQHGQPYRVIEASPRMLDTSDEDYAPSQAAEVPTPEVLKLTSARGETFITKTDPDEEAKESMRRLVLRLLRESIRYYSAKGTDPRTVTRVPSFRDLEWSSETWVRAVNALKPHVVAKQGRGGGTYCTAQYPNLMVLYTAVGERRIVLGVESAPRPEPAPLTIETPSPTLAEAAA